jgi:prophage antirepressor-like protein
MDNNLQMFEFESRKVRIVWEDKEPVFAAKDIVEGVGAVWNGEQAISHIPDEWKILRLNLTISGEKETWFLKEQGVYFYLARCDKPAARSFRKKIAGEVLPFIRGKKAQI